MNSNIAESNPIGITNYRDTMAEHLDRHDHLDDREARAYALRRAIAAAVKDRDAHWLICGGIEGRIHGCPDCVSRLLGVQAILTALVLDEDTVAKLERWLIDLLDDMAP